MGSPLQVCPPVRLASSSSTISMKARHPALPDSLSGKRHLRSMGFDICLGVPGQFFLLPYLAMA
eukprot:55442-Pyramimonas_sp.AAC.1